MTTDKITLNHLPAETLEAIIRRQAKLAQGKADLRKLSIHEIVKYGLCCGSVTAKYVCDKAGINPMWKIPQVLGKITPFGGVGN